MAFLPLDKKFHPDFAIPNKQPLGGVEVDWSNPISRGLWAVFIPSTGRVFNLVDGNEATVTSGATVALKDGQKVYSFDGTSGNSFVANSGPLNSENVTVLSRAHYNATNIDHALLDINNQQLIIWADTSGGGLRPTSFSGSSVVGATGSLNTPSGVYRVWGAQIDNTGTRTAQNWVNGIKSGSSGSVGSTSFGSSTPITFGANSVSAKSSNSEQPIILVWNRTLSDAEMVSASRDLYQVLKPATQTGYFVPSAAGVTSALTGTATATITETDITDGGKTIIVTLTGDTFKAAGTGPIGSTADTQAFIDGFDAAASPTNGFNNEVRDKALTSEVARTSSTVATWTIAAQAGYDISSTETITGTIPTDVLVTGAGAITSTPTFTIDPVSGFQVAWARNSNTIIQVGM